MMPTFSLSRLPVRLPSRLAALFASALMAGLMTGCATPLERTYKGEVHLQSLQVNMASLVNDSEDAKGGSSVISDIQRVVQSIEEAFDEETTLKLITQLNDFEKILVQGIRDASGVPLVAAEPTSVTMTHGKHNEMTGITYEYAKVKDDQINLIADIVYTSTDSTSIGFGFGGREILKVKPLITLNIDGKTRKGKPFWYQSVNFQSKKYYTFADNYLFGVATDKLEEGTIFLVPLAEGVVKNLKKEMKK